MRLFQKLRCELNTRLARAICPKRARLIVSRHGQYRFTSGWSMASASTRSRSISN